MGIIVKGEITIAKGFETWKKMVFSNNKKLEEHGVKFIFSRPQKDNPTKLHDIMQFPNMGAIEAFGNDDELTAQRIEPVAVIESGIITPISEDYFTNYPDAHTKH